MRARKVRVEDLTFNALDVSVDLQFEYILVEVHEHSRSTSPFCGFVPKAIKLSRSWTAWVEVMGRALLLYASSKIATGQAIALA